VGTRCADHVTPFYPQKLALTSPTGGGRSVGIVRVRTKATELYIYCNVMVLAELLASVSSNDEMTTEEQNICTGPSTWQSTLVI